jgi:2-dehydro-3-deoxyphosphooctonate aldolase (KDO 8-P synthase)
LVLAAAKTGKAVNLKKGQFMAPEDMGSIAEKIESVGNHNILLTERGTFFGYHNLVVDMRSLVIMRNLGYPVVFDATHSLQLPGSGSGFSGGQPQFIFPLARAAVACGCDALFIETHPDVENALCDKDSMLPLEKLEELLVQVIEIDRVVKEKIGVARLVSRQP